MAMKWMALQNPEIAPKKWWGLIKLHYGNKIHSNIPALVDRDRVITVRKKKLHYLMIIFALYMKLKMQILFCRFWMFFKM